MLAGGCEAPFVPSIYGAFCQSGIMARTSGKSDFLPRPFAKNRGGIILGEGAGIIILEDLEHALARKANIYAEIVGSSNTCDGFDMIRPRTDGIEASRAIYNAVQEANISPSDVDVVFTHAPGSREADEIEMKALKTVFKSFLKQLNIANLKSMLGYAQGATTAFEMVAACLCMQNGFIPPIINSENAEIPLRISNSVQEVRLKHALLDCFGFGGKNVCLVIKAYSNGY
jgi:3-oxoacyl-[acyl-carrier-protein] synthase II